MSQTNTGHPKGLYVLFITEMWERFSYYGMRAIFVLFMAKALLFDKALGSQIYGSYTGLVYLTPLLGGYMADRYWGNRKSIIIGGILMAIGQFFMFIAGSFFQEAFAPMVMFVGLGFLIFGNGFFKPNISTMVGQLYPEGDKRVDSAFTIFYMGINLGAFIAPLLCGYLGDTGSPEDFKWGFLAACVGMIVSVILFVSLKNKYIVTPEGEQIGVKPNVSRNDLNATGEKLPFNFKQLFIWVSVFIVLFVLFFFVIELDLIGTIIFALTIVAPGYIISDASLTKIEKDKIWVIYIAAFFVIFFWAAFEQAGASLTYFAEEQTDRSLFGKVVPASYFQSINAVAIVIFAPIFVWIWGGLGKRNLEPASPLKQAMGLFLLAIGYLVIAFGVKGIDPSTKVSMGWLVSLYTIHTFGELCLSPIGLSMVNKLSPGRLASLLMGVWFLSTASANKFAGTLSALYPEEVKIEKSFTNETDVKNIDALTAFMIDSSVWNADPKATSSLPVANIQIVKTTSNDADSIVAIEATANKAEVSNFHLKLIKMSNDGLDRAVLFDNGSKLITREITEKVIDRVPIKSTKIQVWNLAPQKPSFMGFQINTLYDFFMVFVFMAGASSVVLFFLSKKLLKMMHGIK
ncbi:MAG: peptide MFS transporter [Bacteroidia bacterium]|nr:peptide MFS transporter [Bacteroidia bacterium]MBP9689963.1 peptide MFS transporter [Bacteroidia bacterium]